MLFRSSRSGAHATPQPWAGLYVHLEEFQGGTSVAPAAQVRPTFTTVYCLHKNIARCDPLTDLPTRAVSGRWSDNWITVRCRANKSALSAVMVGPVGRNRLVPIDHSKKDVSDPTR